MDVSLTGTGPVHQVQINPKMTQDGVKLPNKRFCWSDNTKCQSIIRSERKMNADTEINMRLHLLNYLNVTDKEFRKIFNAIDRKSIASRSRENFPLEIDLKK